MEPILGGDETPKPLIKNVYAFHKPSESSKATIRQLRRAFSRLHDVIEGNVPPSRERAIALTHLETAAMFAIKAVVSNDPQSETSL